MLRFVIALFIASCCFPRSGAAQCDRDWLPGDGIPGVNGAVVGAAEFDPDGSGPQPTKLFVVGDFTVAGNQFVSGGAAWNGTSWENTGANLNAVGLQKVGEALYLAAGNSVYKWDSGWKVIAAFNSSNAPITGLYSYRGGLYVLSPSTQITPSLGYGPQSACYGLARFDGSRWEVLGSATYATGMRNGNQLAFYPDGRVVIGINGDYYIVQGSSVMTALTAVFPFSSPSKCFVINNELYIYASQYVTGTSGPKSNYLLRWNGRTDSQAWDRSPAPAGWTTIVPPLTAADGFVYVRTASQLLTWDLQTFGVAVDGAVGEFWTPVDSGFVFGGAATSLGPAGGHRVTRFRSQPRSWEVMGEGFNGGVRFMKRFQGNLVAVGSFTRAGKYDAKHVAVRVNGEWKPMSNGLENFNVAAVVGMAEINGKLYIGGESVLYNAATQTRAHVLVWTGERWEIAPAFPTNTTNWPMRAFLEFQGKIAIVRSAAAYLYDGVTTTLLSFTYDSENAIISAGVFENGSKLLLGYNSERYGPWQYLRYRYRIFDGVALTTSDFHISSNTYDTFYFRNMWSDGSQIAMMSSNSIPLIWKGNDVWESVFPGGAPYGASFYTICFTSQGLVIGGYWDSSWIASNLALRKIDGTTTTIPSSPQGSVWASHWENDTLAIGGPFVATPKVVSAYFAEWAPVDRSPHLVSSPTDVNGCWYRNALFKVQATSDGNISYQWRRNGVDLIDGLTGTGSKISGSRQAILQITVPARGKLTEHDVGDYDCVIWNECGTATSAPAQFYLVGSDFNCNSVVDDADFLAFSAAYDRMLCTAAGMPANCQADLNADGVVDDSDFSIFVVAYERFLAN